MIDPDESSPEEFAEAVGRAIIAWQRVEMACSQLFAWLLRAKTLGANAIFYHIKSYSTRIEIMDIAARFRLAKAEQKATWADLRRRLIDLSAMRNRIAHGDIDEAITPTGWKFKLVPPMTDFSRLDPTDPKLWAQRRNSKTVHYQQVLKAKAEFSRLADDLDTLALTLMPRRTQRTIRAVRRGALTPELGSDGQWQLMPPKQPPKKRETTRRLRKKLPPRSSRA